MKPQKSKLLLSKLTLLFAYFVQHFHVLKKGLDTDFHNQKVPFPSVTICPNEPFSEEAVNQTAFKILGESEDNFDSMIALLQTLPKLSYANIPIVAAALQNVTQTDQVNKLNLRELVFDLGMKCSELFVMCNFKDDDISCCDYFMAVFTEHGFCYSFNARYYSTVEGE